MIALLFLFQVGFSIAVIREPTTVPKSNPELIYEGEDWQPEIIQA